MERNATEFGMQFFTDKQLAERFGVSRPTVWRWVAAGAFPKPIRLGPNVTRWSAADVEAWLAQRGAA
jgi:excisionase family DNA binding protein